MMAYRASCGALAALTMVAGCGGMATCEERPVTQGFNPAISPDGRLIAFQRLDGDVFKLGVTDIRGSEVKWVEEGPGNAAYPEWTPSGGLVYMAGHDAETAYEAWKGGSKNGYGLWLWENGRKRSLTTGRCRDYTPCVSPDGRKVYFVTTRGVSSESPAYSKAASTRIAELDLAEGGEPRVLMDSPNGNNSGFVQPAVSPDGKTLVWGHLENFFDTWRIYGTRVGRFEKREWCPVTPPGLTAISPRWHPNGRLICFSGFRRGDPGWGVWVEDVTTGRVKRLATGENPCFSPGGKAIAYDRDGVVYVRPFTAEDLPDEAMPEPCDECPPEKVLWTAENVSKETRIELDDARFSFGNDRTFFVRLRVRLDGTEGLRQMLIGDYAEHEYGFQLFANYAVWFSTRDRTGRYLDVKSPSYKGAREYTFTGIRFGRKLLLSVDGAAPAVSVPRAQFLSLGHLRRFIVGRGLKPGESVVKAEVGTGWPSDVPKYKTRADLFGESPEARKPEVPKARKVDGPAFQAFAPSPPMAPRPATPLKPSGRSGSGAFEVVALVDSLDFAKVYDIETATGTVQTLEHVLLTHANDIWWRDKGGGRMRYPSECEMWQLSEAPFDKKRLPSEDIYGYLRLESPRGNEFPLVREECLRRGLGFGIHTTIEENHWYSPLASNWTLAHPQYWCCTRDGDPWMGSCSIMWPEVIAHKLRMVDERLALKPQKIMLDSWRNGAWTFAREYSDPAIAEWRSLHGDEPVPEATDPRWQKMVGAHFDDYLRKFSAKCRAAGVEFIGGFVGVDDKDDAALRSRYSGFSWRHLAKEGVFDAVYVMSVTYDPKDPFGSTERIYRNVMENRGSAEVYFPLASYNFEKCSYGEYAKLTGVSDVEAARRLLDMARRAGARGVVLECVDHGNYSPAVCAAIAEWLKKEGTRK